ncbi:MAG: YeaH/YhbH family protein [Alphaproteobacteria bacterium]|nr:YeaH/YhbH family protein [Alphaproteobacteria bacterium]MCD8520220.1 YeaH/YhbH family protein [Alphaproteobacteria bacterium]MCD8525924.1 YeaH/YhbH family protein [Alphaproteobacteria bacterium]MCD8570449.1 YeaH/YhbH family protein [Alphaproteobacteria bacterium]
MTVIRDRREEPPNDKFATDKQRFRDRYLERVRKAIQDDVANRGFQDIGKDGIKIPIPKETTREPIFHHVGGNPKERVYPGNRYDVGDKILKPGGGGGGGQGNGEGASDQDSDAQDDFIWINESEYLEILFEGRSLPDMTKLKAKSAKTVDREHSGYTTKGPEHRLDTDKTDKKRKDEEMILAKGAEKRILENLAEQFNILSQYGEKAQTIELRGKSKQEKRDLILNIFQHVNTGADVNTAELSKSPEAVISILQQSVDTLNDRLRAKVTADEEHRLGVLETRLQDQFKGRSKAGKLREEHLVYEYDDDVPRPNAKAVMFCQMDVSASMEQEDKNAAKVFFWLLNKFLKEKYDEVDVVFIAHTTTAKEVDEQTFFYGQETGGTIVSSCLEKTMEIIQERYPVSEWNIYSAQASDGDNWQGDNFKITKLMDKLLPILQAHYYIEVGKPAGYESDLFMTYETISSRNNGKVHTASGIETPSDALEAFKSFFPVGGAGPSSSYSPSPA